MKDGITVIIPCYNVEKYLDSCVQSIINQTYKNLEIILVDDCSTDNTWKIITLFQILLNRGAHRKKICPLFSKK